MIQTFSDKRSIAATFGRSAAGYAAQAKLQKDCAAELVALLVDWQIPTGDILEIGCGTGFVTQQLIDRFPNRSITATDLSEAMLQSCQDGLHPDQTNVQFQQQDGEAIAADRSYVLIAGGFVIQWFHNPVKSLLRLLAQLQPGGVLLVSFPTCRSFPEWRQLCQLLDLPCTVNPLPDPDAIAAALSPLTQARLLHRSIPLHYASAAQFLRSFKAIGANTSQTGKQLSPHQLRQLIRAWDRISPDGVTVHSDVCFGVFQK